MAVNQYDSETISGSFNLGLSFFRWQHHTESDRELKKQGNSIDFPAEESSHIHLVFLACQFTRKVVGKPCLPTRWSPGCPGPQDP